MRSAERRFTWALIAGGLATGLGAGHTDAPLYNILVGIAWGVPVWIGTWALLETLHYLQESRDEAGNLRRPTRGATVHVMYGRREDGER